MQEHLPIALYRIRLTLLTGVERPCDVVRIVSQGPTMVPEMIIGLVDVLHLWRLVLESGRLIL